MQPHEVLLNVHIPFTKEYDYVREYKQAHRRDDDIAIANAGMRVRMQMGTQGTPFHMSRNSKSYMQALYQ